MVLYRKPLVFRKRQKVARFFKQFDPQDQDRSASNVLAMYIRSLSHSVEISVILSLHIPKFHSEHFPSVICSSLSFLIFYHESRHRNVLYQCRMKTILKSKRELLRELCPSKQMKKTRQRFLSQFLRSRNHLKHAACTLAFFLLHAFPS